MSDRDDRERSDPASTVRAGSGDVVSHGDRNRISSCLKATDADGLIVDFHSLRVTFSTLLVKSGATVKAAQELARHCDPKLTMNIYSRLGVHDLAGTLGALPSTSNAPESVRKGVHGGRTRPRATGTDPNLTEG